MIFKSQQVLDERIRENRATVILFSHVKQSLLSFLIYLRPFDCNHDTISLEPLPQKSSTFRPSRKGFGAKEVFLKKLSSACRLEFLDGRKKKRKREKCSWTTKYAYVTITVKNNDIKNNKKFM